MLVLLCNLEFLYSKIIDLLKTLDMENEANTSFLKTKRKLVHGTIFLFMDKFNLSYVFDEVLWLTLILDIK